MDPSARKGPVEMKDRFNVRIPVSEDPKVKEIEALHVKEIAEKDYDTDVLGTALPVVLDFYGTDSKACEVLAPRFAAVAEKFAGKARFLKVKLLANAQLASKLGVTASPTVVFLAGGKEKGERLTGEDIKRTDLKARVEAMLGVTSASANPST
jgi:thiol-disulfide isomerase/thioredoxin